MRITRLSIIVIGLILITLLWLLFGYFGIQALFTNRTVNEPFPSSFDASHVSASPNPTPGELSVTSSSPQIVWNGEFTQGDSTYLIKGSAHVVTEGTTKTLVLSDFSVTNGPDLFIYLVATSSTKNSEVKSATNSGHFVQVAALKGNIGNQTYTLPADLDISQYSVVSIWCRRFSRNFGSAMLRVE